MSESEEDSELDAITRRYAVRERNGATGKYSWIKPDVYLSALESDRVILQILLRAGLKDLPRLTLLEVGCGTGGNLLRFLRWGFDATNLVGNELLPARLREARRRLPAEVKLIEGDACELDCEPFDIVYQSTVFSSILDEAFQVKLANHMWKLTKPGGGVLWYDFCYDNPKNLDVRGIPVQRIGELFPGSIPFARRVTLAPPLCRFATRFSTRLYPVLNAFPVLRTHVLCWIPKAAPHH